MRVLPHRVDGRLAVDNVLQSCGHRSDPMQRQYHALMRMCERCPDLLSQLATECRSTEPDDFLPFGALGSARPMCMRRAMSPKCRTPRRTAVYAITRVVLVAKTRRRTRNCRCIRFIAGCSPPDVQGCLRSRLHVREHGGACIRLGSCRRNPQGVPGPMPYGTT